ncbi:MAG TPA: hypothetical protein VIU11_00300 [Nakamurella sp.]
MADLRRVRDVAAAVRSDERRLLDALHDTAAGTLLMVGMGVAADNGSERPSPGKLPGGGVPRQHIRVPDVEPAVRATLTDRPHLRQMALAEAQGRPLPAPRLASISPEAAKVRSSGLVRIGSPDARGCAPG